MGKLKIFTLMLTLFMLTSCAGETFPARAPEPLVYADADTAAVPAEDALDEPLHEAARISFVAAGDNVIHPCIYIDARNRGYAAGKYDFMPMYADAAEYIAGFDVAFINQETLMAEGFALSGYPYFNSPQDLGRDLRDLGFDVVNIANNHMCDKGDDGLAQTIAFWKSEEMSDVTLIGGYTKSDYDDVRVTEVEGVKIAWLSYTYGTNGLRLTSESEYLVPYIDDETIVRQCAIADEAADVTIVSIHWGDENMPVNDEQRRLAKLMAEQSVDVIIGHHPHVIQPIEWIETDAGETLCIYSLGNLVSGMERWKNMVGGFFEFELSVMSDGTITVENPAFVPTAFYYGPNWLNSHLFFLMDYTDAKAATHGSGIINNSPATPADMIDYARSIMGDFMRLDPRPLPE